MATHEIHLMPSQIDLSNPKSFPPIKFEKKTTQPKKDESTGQTEAPQSYNTAPLNYNHKNPKTNKYEKQERWLVQAPKMKSRGGLVAAKKNGRWGCYIVCSSLDLKTEGMAEFLGQSIDIEDWMNMPEVSTEDTLGKKDVGFMQNLYLRLAEQAYVERASIGLGSVKKANSMEASFKNPVKWPTDSSGNVIPGSAPTMLFKVFLMGDPAKSNTRKAIFSIPDPTSKTGERPIPWEYLQEAEIEFEPLVCFKSVYAGGGKASIQMEIVSAVLHSFVRLNSQCDQKELIEKYSTDEKLTTKLNEQLQQMMDLMGDSTSSSSSKKTPEEDTKKDTKKKLPPPPAKKPSEDDDDNSSKKKKLPAPKKQDDDDDDIPDSPVKKDKKKLALPKKQDDDDDVADSPIKKDKKKLAASKKHDDDDDDAESVAETPKGNKKKKHTEKKTEVDDTDELE